MGKLFEKGENGLRICVEGMHVRSTGAILAVFHEVTPCDGTCRDKSALQEIEFSREEIEELQSRLGKGPKMVSALM